MVHWDMPSLGLSGDHFVAKDLLDGMTYNWSSHTFVSLDPTVGKTAHIAQVKLP